MRSLTYPPELARGLSTLTVSPVELKDPELGNLVALTAEERAQFDAARGPIFGHGLSVFKFAYATQRTNEEVALALLKISLAIRLTRAGVREAMGQDYVKFARAKGLSTRRIIFVHVLKNIMIPVVTVMGLEFGSLIAFSVVTESIFAWPGMGKLLIDAIIQLDRPIVVAYLMIIVLLFVIINLIVDIVYSILDPRVRLQEQGT